MRTLLALLIAFFLVPALAQSGARTRPPGTLPLEEVPSPPPIPDTAEPGSTIAQEVTTRTEDGQTIEEYRHQGKLYMVRVTPRHGRPYVLVDQRGDGQFTRQDNPLGTGLRVPQWVIFEF